MAPTGPSLPCPLGRRRAPGADPGAHRHQAELERSELALEATRAAYAGDVRDLYARGPLAPLELPRSAAEVRLGRA